MSAGGNGDFRPPRLDPFRLPSETGFRFLLLISAVFGSALFAYNWLYFTLSDRGHEQAVSLGCDATFRRGVSHLGAVSATSSQFVTGFAKQSRAFTDCLAQVTHPKGDWMIAGVLGLTVLSVVLYALTPRWKLRRGRFVPLAVEDAGPVVSELAELCRRAGLARNPAFIWNPLDRSVSGLAFGAFGRYRVGLSGGLVTKYHSDLGAFRAVVLHELAHIRNRDIDRIYLTVAIWNAFVLAAALPLVIALATGGDNRTFFDVGWRLVVLSALVYLSRNAVLRVRELYADVRADTTGGDAIRRLVSTAPGSGEHRIRRLLRVHPSASRRASAIADTDTLFRIGVGEALGAGIVMTLVFHQLVTLLTFYHPDPDPTMWIAALGVAPLVVGIVGMQIWRAAYAATMRGTTVRGVWTAGLVLGAGALLGEALSFDQLGSVTGSRSSSAILDARLEGGVKFEPGIVSSAIIGWGAVWAAIIVLSMLALVWWISAGATVWLERGAHMAPWRAATGGCAAATAVLAVWMGIFFLSYEVAWPAYLYFHQSSGLMITTASAAAWIGPEQLFRLLTDTEILYFASRWFVLPTLILVVVFPFAAALFYRTPRPVSDSAFLDAPAPSVSIWTRFWLRRAVLVGVAAGIGILLAAIGIRAGVHAWEGLDQRATDGFLFAFIYWMYASIFAGECVAAFVAAVVCPTNRLFHGALAGLIAGLIGTGSLALGKAVDSCATPLSLGAHAHGCPEFATLSFTESTYQQVLGVGILAALAVGGIVALGAYVQRWASA
jgi:Zn-dependent protease with chaperone function